MFCSVSFLCAFGLPMVREVVRNKNEGIIKQNWRLWDEPEEAGDELRFFPLKRITTFRRLLFGSCFFTSAQQQYLHVA